MKVGELQTCLDADTARAEANVPKHMTARQVKGLQGEQADGHLRYHLLTAIQQGKLAIRKAPSALMPPDEDEAVGVSKLLP
jgi:hypothetical protein